ncbi:MAG: CoA pyrophosphatase [Gammaproteobacteria bacterium]|jgi:8-oxo-dGTP pyrophosphatase MutT (NUDIX family)|nr:CoA pyrophosphatase [Gammaproteobacteria bacterium]
MFQCDDRLRELIRAHLDAFEVRPGAGAAKAAAVALAVVDGAHGPSLSGLPDHDEWQAHAALILTRRSSKLRNHAGQWALPGGRIDAGESPEDTALREMREEVGLALDHRAVIGRLDDFVTRSGFSMTPVVIWAGPQAALEPNPDEVDSIHRIPVHEFMREDAPLLEHLPEGGAPVLRMPIGDSWIAAPTAAILYQFREVCLCGRATRVAHYEQPTFAWR